MSPNSKTPRGDRHRSRNHAYDGDPVRGESFHSLPAGVEEAARNQSFYSLPAAEDSTKKRVRWNLEDDTPELNDAASGDSVVGSEEGSHRGGRGEGDPRAREKLKKLILEVLEKNKPPLQSSETGVNAEESAAAAPNDEEPSKQENQKLALEPKRQGRNLTGHQEGPNAPRPRHCVDGGDICVPSIISLPRSKGGDASISSKQIRSLPPPPPPRRGNDKPMNNQSSQPLRDEFSEQMKHPRPADDLSCGDFDGGANSKQLSPPLSGECNGQNPPLSPHCPIVDSLSTPRPPPPPPRLQLSEESAVELKTGVFAYCNEQQNQRNANRVESNNNYCHSKMNIEHDSSQRPPPPPPRQRLTADCDDEFGSEALGEKHDNHKPPPPPPRPITYLLIPKQPPSKMTEQTRGDDSNSKQSSPSPHSTRDEEGSHAPPPPSRSMVHGKKSNDMVDTAPPAAPSYPTMRSIDGMPFSKHDATGSSSLPPRRPTCSPPPNELTNRTPLARPPPRRFSSTPLTRHNSSSSPAPPRHPRGPSPPPREGTFEARPFLGPDRDGPPRLFAPPPRGALLQTSVTSKEDCNETPGLAQSSSESRNSFATPWFGGGHGDATDGHKKGSSVLPFPPNLVTERLPLSSKPRIGWGLNSDEEETGSKKEHARHNDDRDDSSTEQSIEGDDEELLYWNAKTPHADAANKKKTKRSYDGGTRPHTFQHTDAFCEEIHQRESDYNGTTASRDCVGEEELGVTLPHRKKNRLYRQRNNAFIIRISLFVGGAVFLLFCIFSYASIRSNNRRNVFLKPEEGGNGDSNTNMTTKQDNIDVAPSMDGIYEKGDALGDAMTDTSSEDANPNTVNANNTLTSLITASIDDSRLEKGKSYGIIFDVEIAPSMSPSSSPVIIAGMDFYLIHDTTLPIHYEVWTKSGSWQDGISKRTTDYLSEFRQVSKGIITTERGAGALDNFLMISLPEFQEVKIPRRATRCAFYVTLSDDLLLFESYEGKRGGTDGGIIDRHEMESIVQASSAALNVYYGSAIRAYPLELADLTTDFWDNAGFLGRVWTR
eukprot:CAMPEP_0172535032 /NCGR_PEP_ID=MMETSP1067-20121228/7206_1 /TAXON_ID=265564 ORGANISM="Thalassiosira punctigera, Strain Tpunct2005C2" /NCGR_SAMPLE_ID=MMETSP1067 /ASSEMBLY_ACC=CAM_ASM_000444 /LENGTH=1050 /DNA_ID=CAMNT_0013319923 /DNA_START=217 /DNA_END=3369 /DNA_ORIENTATION=+